MSTAELNKCFSGGPDCGGMLRQIGGTIAGTDGFWVVIPLSDDHVLDPEHPWWHEPICEGPWETEEEAQHFIDNEVGAETVRIVEVRNGNAVRNPFLD